MGKVRVVKIFDAREAKGKDGRRYYVVDSMVNFLVDEKAEYYVRLFSDFPLVDSGDYDVRLNGIAIRVKQVREFPFPGFPIPGIPNPNAKKPL